MKKYIKRITYLFFFATLFATLLPAATGCMRGNNAPPLNEITEKTAFSMDTVAKITVYGDSEVAEVAIVAAFERLERLDEVFNYYNPESELSHINATAYGKATEIGDDMYEMIRAGLICSKVTDGAFDISLGLLIDLWGDEKTPSKSVIELLLPKLGYENIVVKDENGLRTVEYLNESVKIHFGAIAKGYAVDELILVLSEKGVKSAMVDIGGEIGVIGESPHEDGLWRVGIRDPFNTGEIIETIKLSEGYAVATSGNYERGEHIFDPKTGFPVDIDYSAVTVVGSSGTKADAFATAFFVTGIENCTEEMGYACVICVDKEGNVGGDCSVNCNHDVVYSGGGGTALD
ncbi:MAG: FAD:protein FMN transferase [Oscillospiraceae bacterium]|nr:FAD:protein FMN transferase [Oscillospiraceae bacterium]